jgi:hypothetical protein
MSIFAVWEREKGLTMKYLLYKLDRNNLFSTDKKEEYIIKNFSPKPWDLYMREEKISIRECFF